MSMIIQSGRRPAVAAAGGGWPYTTGLILDLDASEEAGSFGSTVDPFTDRSGQVNNFAVDNGTPSLENATSGQAVRLTNADSDRYGPHDYADLDLTALTMFVAMDIRSVVNLSYIVSNFGNSNYGWYLRMHSSGPVLRFGIGNGSTTTTLTTSTFATGPMLFGVRFEDGYQQLTINGSVAYSNTFAWTMAYDSNVRAALGAVFTSPPSTWLSTNCADVDIHQLAIFDHVLSDTNFNSNRTHLNDKWSIY